MISEGALSSCGTAVTEVARSDITGVEVVRPHWLKMTWVRTVWCVGSFIWTVTGGVCGSLVKRRHTISAAWDHDLAAAVATTHQQIAD